MAELGGEKIDIIEWSEDPVKFIANSLSPAKIINVQLDMEEKEAKVGVMEDQLSLAIGKAGQNVRLAARLTGWKIDINQENVGTSTDGEESDAETEGDVEIVDEASHEETDAVEPEQIAAPDESVDDVEAAPQVAE